MRRPAAHDLPPEPPIVPELTRASALFLFLQSGVWTALVALGLLSVVFLVVGPVFTAWGWLIWAMLRRRARVD